MTWRSYCRAFGIDDSTSSYEAAKYSVPVSLAPRGQAKAVWDRMYANYDATEDPQ